MIGRQIRAAREAKGLTLRAVAARAYINPGYLSQIERDLRTPSPLVLTRLSEFLETELRLPEIAPIEPIPVAPGADTPALLTDVLAAQRRLEDSIGSAVVVAPTVAQLHLIKGLVAEARGLARRNLLPVAAQWAVFTGWLRTATGRHDHADRAFALAADWALEGGDPTLLSHVYSFKGYAAGRRGDIAGLEGLTGAARRMSTIHHAQQAYNGFQHARALSRLGDPRRAGRALDEAVRASEAARQEGDPPPYAYWYTPAFFTLNIGLTHVWMGNQHEAADMIKAGLHELSEDQRNSEWADEFRKALATSAPRPR